MPYIGFHPEYPPLAFFFIYFPFFITDNSQFYLFIYKSLAFYAVVIGTFFVYKWRKNISDVWIYLLLLFILQSSQLALVLQRFDIFVAVLTAAAVYYFFKKHQVKTGWILLLLATFIKLYPIILVPLFFLKSKRRLTVLWYIVPFIIINAVLLFVTNGKYADFLSQQSGRPVGYESVLASFFQLSHLLFNTPIQPVSALNSWGLATDPTMLFIAKVILWIAILFPFISKFKRIRTFHPLHLCLIIITCFIAGNIVFSPQYLEWLIPFIFILAIPELILFTVITGLTAWFFSFWVNPSNEWLMLLIVVRNILFLIFYFRLFSEKAVQHFPPLNKVKEED